jgi:hypothetical protein
MTAYIIIPSAIRGLVNSIIHARHVWVCHRDGHIFFRRSAVCFALQRSPAGFEIFSAARFSAVLQCQKTQALQRSGSCKTHALQRYRAALQNSMKKAEKLKFFQELRQKKGPFVPLFLPRCSAGPSTPALERCSGATKKHCASALQHIQKSSAAARGHPWYAIDICTQMLIMCAIGTQIIHLLRCNALPDGYRWTKQHN